MGENVLKVITEDGIERVINVIDIVEDESNGKEYIIYTFVDGEDIYASILVEKEDSVILETITSNEEWQLVNEVISSLDINGVEKNV